MQKRKLIGSRTVKGVSIPWIILYLLLETMEMPSHPPNHHYDPVFSFDKLETGLIGGKIKVFTSTY